MLISDSATRVFDEITARERDLMQSFTPGAVAEKKDASQPSSADFTLNPLSAAAPPNAYFVTMNDRGGMLFSRDGSFALRDGSLVDSSGRAVMGYRDGAAVLAPLRADAVDAALGFTANARIEPDGSVTYDRATVDPRSGRREIARARIGRLAFARFAPGTKLQSIDPTHLAAPAAIEPHLGMAGDGNFAQVEPFARERSGVDIDLGLQRLQEAYLALDALRAAEKSHDGLQKTAMDLLK